MQEDDRSNGSGRPSTGPQTSLDTPPSVSVVHRGRAAVDWYACGLAVIPVRPGTKQPAVRWDPWLTRLSAEAVAEHWRKYPGHDVGAILGDDLIVFDADSPAAVEALEAIEQRYGVTPVIRVRTRRGAHHYFRRAAGTFAKSDAHDTAAHPERIDVKTGRALVVLPPSGGRELITGSPVPVANLAEVGQDFIDAIFEHNGRPAPRPPKISSGAPPADLPLEVREAEIAALLKHLDPDCGYDDWLHVLMAVHRETVGSESGFALVDAWSGRGRKYRGAAEVERKWRSFASDPATAYSIATLMRMVEATGVDPLDVLAAVGPQFEPCEYVVVGEDGVVRDPDAPIRTPLDRFSLRGRSQDVEKNVLAQVFVLEPIALLGQMTIIYAAPNTGKTLLVLYLLFEAIRRGRVDPERVYYVNVDDDANGLLTKLRIAEEFALHMLADGYMGFGTADFLDVMREMVAKDQARGVVVILDTLKKFTDLMDKAKASAFTKVARQFVVKGGTIICLAHTNKHPGADGRPVFAGTTDVRDDSDCVFTLRALDAAPGDTEKFVIFENIKKRGNVAAEAAYRYCIESGISYDELLASVKPFDQTELLALKETEAERSDAELIAVVAGCVREGIKTKMRLVDAAAERAGVRKRTAIRVIERYTGDDPAQHRWRYTVQERGAKVFELIELPSPAADDRGLDPLGGRRHG